MRDPWMAGMALDCRVARHAPGVSCHPAVSLAAPTISEAGLLSGSTMLEMAMNEMHLSARAHDRILKVARTIANLAGAEAIQANHVMEAIQFRSLDRRLRW